MEEALRHFKKVDPKLYKTALIIKLSDHPKTEDYFISLIESIISQQLSIKASGTIFNRFKKLFPKEKITPEKILKISDQKIRECGISYSKIKYIKGIAQAVINKEINFQKLDYLKDEEIINELIKLKGVGKWTAEMFLMFTLGRKDVFSAGDLGLKNAMIKIYNLEKPTQEELLSISEKWSPHRTIASRILWKSLEKKAS